MKTETNVICLEERRQCVEKFSVKVTLTAHAIPTAMSLHGHLVDLLMSAAESERMVLVERMRRDDEGHVWLDVVTFKQN